jgi:hypothetical protein
MIDSIVKIADKLTQLLALQKKHKEEKFEVFVQPIFEEMKLVHQDYMSMFNGCRAMLLTNEPVSSVLERLMSDRVEKIEPRSRVISLSESFLASRELSTYSDFYESIQDYFTSTDMQGHNSPSSHVIVEIEDWIDRKGKKDIERMHIGHEGGYQILRSLVEKRISILEHKWAAVLRAYGQTLLSTKA